MAASARRPSWPTRAITEWKSCNDLGSRRKTRWGTFGRRAPGNENFMGSNENAVGPRRKVVHMQFLCPSKVVMMDVENWSPPHFTNFMPIPLDVRDVVDEDDERRPRLAQEDGFHVLHALEVSCVDKVNVGRRQLTSGSLIDSVGLRLPSTLYS